MCGSWMLVENIRPFLEIIAGLVGTEVDGWDWDAIALGLKDTDHELGRWFSYQFTGARGSISLRLALESGTSLFFATVESDNATEAKCDVVVNILQHYRLTV